MAEVLTIEERRERLKAIMGKLRHIDGFLSGLRRERDAYFRDSLHPAVIAARMNTGLSGLEDLFDSIVADMQSLDWVYAARVQPNEEQGFASFAVNQTLTAAAVGATPFNVFQQNDYIDVIRAENSDNKGIVQVLSVYAQSMLMNAAWETNNLVDSRLAMVLRDRGGTPTVIATSGASPDTYQTMKGDPTDYLLHVTPETSGEFNSFNINDVVTYASTETSANDGNYTVLSRSASSLWLQCLDTGKVCVDNQDDEGVTVTLIERA